MRLAGHARDDGRTPRRQFVDHGNVEVAVEREGKRARDWRGGQNEYVRGAAVRRGLVHQPFALQDAESVLLVNRHKSQPPENDVIFDQRVRADHELRFPARDSSERRGLFRKLHSANQQFHFVSGFFQNATRG